MKTETSERNSGITNELMSRLSCAKKRVIISELEVTSIVTERGALSRSYEGETINPEKTDDFKKRLDTYIDRAYSRSLDNPGEYDILVKFNASREQIKNVLTDIRSI